MLRSKPLSDITPNKRTFLIDCRRQSEATSSSKKTPPPSGHQNKGAAIATSLQLIHRFRSGYTQRDRPLDASAFLVSKPWNCLYLNFYVPNRNRSSVWQKKGRQLPYIADSLHSEHGTLFIDERESEEKCVGLTTQRTFDSRASPPIVELRLEHVLKLMRTIGEWCRSTNYSCSRFDTFIQRSDRLF